MTISLSNSQTLLDVHVSGKHYDTRTVLQSVSLSIARGKIVSLVGPSGCGKSTLLRIVAGLDRDYDGRVVLGGKDSTDLPGRSASCSRSRACCPG
jgi:sulfonate transport system ATP-binding protein